MSKLRQRVLDLIVTRSIQLRGKPIQGDWLPMELGSNLTAQTTIDPSSALKLGQVVLRGALAWSNQTFAADTTLAILAEPHRPKTVKYLDVRTSPTSNVATQLVIGTDGTIKNVSGLGTGSTATLGLDGKGFDLE